MSGAVVFVLAALAGLLAGATHALLLHRAVARAVHTGRPAALLLGAPLRILLPALVVLALAPLGLAAIAGSLVGIVIASQAARWHASRSPVDEDGPA